MSKENIERKISKMSLYFMGNHLGRNIHLQINRDLNRKLEHITHTDLQISLNQQFYVHLWNIATKYEQKNYYKRNTGHR